jgi:hypothetical protein
VNGRRVLSWLRDKGQRVALLILLICTANLYFTIRGYYLILEGNKPNLISVAPKLDSNAQPTSVILSWFNAGKESAIGGKVVLFAVNNGITKRRKIGQVPLTGGLPGNMATAKFAVDMRQSLEFFLVCAVYDDNAAAHQQLYLYRLGTPTDEPSQIPLVEEPQSRLPNFELCNE